MINKKNLVSKKLSYGELVYTGKNVMLGYALNKTDLNKDNYKKRLFTGDIAKKIMMVFILLKEETIVLSKLLVIDSTLMKLKVS